MKCVAFFAFSFFFSFSIASCSPLSFRKSTSTQERRCLSFGFNEASHFAFGSFLETPTIRVTELNVSRCSI